MKKTDWTKICNDQPSCLISNYMSAARQVWTKICGKKRGHSTEVCEHFSANSRSKMSIDGVSRMQTELIGYAPEACKKQDLSLIHI